MFIEFDTRLFDATIEHTGKRNHRHGRLQVQPFFAANALLARIDPLIVTQLVRDGRQAKLERTQVDLCVYLCYCELPPPTIPWNQLARLIPTKSLGFRLCRNQPAAGSSTT